MLNLTFLQQLLIVATALSTITCAFVQKTKRFFKTSSFLSLYSLIVNIGIGIVFCLTFTSIEFPESLWVGLFSFLGADTIYKSLEGAISSHKDLVTKDVIEVKKENLIRTGSED